MITIPNPRRIAAINFSKRSVNFIMVSFYPVYLSSSLSATQSPIVIFMQGQVRFSACPKKLNCLAHRSYRYDHFTELWHFTSSLLIRSLQLLVILLHTLPQSLPIRIKNDLCSPVFCSSLLS